MLRNLNKTHKIRAAVIGVGHLGQYHAQKYTQLEDADLVAVVDSNSDCALQVSSKCNSMVISDYKLLVGKVDAVSIATPTKSHYEIAKFCLLNNIHVLVEKPITTNVAQAQELIDIAAERKLLLQVGHIERFNPIITQVQPYINNVRFIDSVRIMPFNYRNQDINVILDLMVHDIDLVLMLVNSKISNIEANGKSVFNSSIDIANARIKFVNGCIANIVSSRVSNKTERKMRIFNSGNYVSLDLQNKNCTLVTLGEEGTSLLSKDISVPSDTDALLIEISSFLQAIIHNRKPVVCGKAGKEALQIAMDITNKVQASMEKI